MSQLAPSPFFRRHAHEWLDQVFQCRAAEVGGVIRRQVVDVEREVGRAEFEAEVKRRGFRLLRTRAYYIVICDNGPIDLLI